MLRLMYIVDMKDLQSEIDKLLVRSAASHPRSPCVADGMCHDFLLYLPQVETQEYTADPRTDSSLGKVGR